MKRPVWRTTATTTEMAVATMPMATVMVVVKRKTTIMQGDMMAAVIPGGNDKQHDEIGGNEHTGNDVCENDIDNYERRRYD